MRCRQVLSIDMLPDDVLLSIFELCADGRLHSERAIEEWWQSLVHVCRRWRTVVFGSPRRLNLRLACSPRTPAGDTLDVWPAYPLAISSYHSSTKGKLDNMLAALEHRHRVCQIRLVDLSICQMEKVLAAMQVPFPELTELVFQVMSADDIAVVPDSFLAGSAPLLRHLTTFHLPFPGLPKLLLSATHLATLRLSEIPHSGYFSPESLLSALSVCTSLRHLSLTFQSPRSCPDQARPPPPPSERIVLHALTDVLFVGASEYLEDLVAGIDAPVKDLGVVLFNDIVLNTPQLVQFISRTPTLKSYEKNCLFLGTEVARVLLSSQTTSHYGQFRMDMQCCGLEWQVSFLEQICTSFMPFHPKLEDLSITLTLSDLDRINKIENTLWLELLRPFTAVKKFELSGLAAQSIVPALQELVEDSDRTTEVLPALENIILRDSEPELESQAVQEGIWQFVAARQAIGHHITTN